MWEGRKNTMALTKVSTMNSGSGNEDHMGLFEWVGRHPGVLLLGTLFVAVMVLTRETESSQADFFGSEEEVPLFV
jgi:hypothetical protein